MEDIGFPIQGQVSSQAPERFERPRNYGPLESFDGHARITGPCGDTMEFWLQVREGLIREANFTTDGCGPSRAAGSMATELAIGKPPKEAAQIDQADILLALDGLPEESEHCALLASTTLKAAIKDFRKRKADKSGDCSHCESTTCTSKQRRSDESEEEFRQRQALGRRMCQIGYKLLVLAGSGQWAVGGRKLEVGGRKSELPTAHCLGPARLPRGGLAARNARRTDVDCPACGLTGGGADPYNPAGGGHLERAAKCHYLLWESGRT